MPSRKTQFVRFNVQFVVKLEHVPPFDSIGAVIGPPDINGFIAAGMKTLLPEASLEKGYIVGTSRLGMYLYFPNPQTLAALEADVKKNAPKKAAKKRKAPR